ncbi:uncharacterized protein TNCV_3929641 [Trichonephila clavipes]|nr:uncharacterized protein TNCV_3929641 [Trichonephila clavipes]
MENWFYREKELQKTEPDDIAVEELLEHLEQKFECLKIVDKECEPLYSPTEIDKEIEAVEQYFDKIVTWRFRAKKQLGKNNKFKSDSDSCKTTEESKLIEPMKTRIELEEAAKDHFARHVTRDADGRYVVSLPWIQGHPFLSNCRNLAERRLKNCVRSLERSKNLGKYEAVFHSWQNEDIIEEVQNVADKKNEHYLPHHPVCKDNSTTKIRPVFDGSAKEKNSSSINECLEKGPNMPRQIQPTWLVHTGVSEAEKGTLLEEEKKVPVLGLIWKPDKDTFSVNWEENSKINEIPETKRTFPNSDLSLHVFCDASKAAYASCVFLRTEVGGAITCQLVQARARVASIKPITIPRLELLACTIGSRLINTTKIDLGLENVPIYCWSDSVNALYWIKRKENWGTFVNNRVQEIRRLTNAEDWKHIPGILNPADLPSRGCGVVELIASLWWEGPSWLNKPREEWPISEACPDRAIIDSERKRTVASTINHEPKEMDYLSEISSFKIIRVTAWIYRFYHNLRKQRNDRDFGELITQETDAAERKVLKIVQKQSFSNDTKSLVSQMQTLVDSEGIIRIKSKIIMRKDVESIRYPIVLPSRHPIVTKLIIQKHIELLHAGVQ